MIPGQYTWLAGSYPFADEGENGPFINIEWDGTEQWEAMGEPTASNLPGAITGKCDHCGANHIYQCIILHNPTGDILSIGHTCARERFGRSDWKNVIANSARRAELKAEREKNIRVAMEAMTEEGRAAYTWATTDKEAHYIAKDISSKVSQYGKLSEKQEAFLVKLHTEAIKKAAELAEAVANETVTPVITGKQVIKGEILSIKWKSNDYGYGTGGSYKMLIRDDRGFKVYGTCPAKIAEDCDKGTKIELTATVEASGDDTYFGFFSRPSKAKVLENAAN